MQCWTVSRFKRMRRFVLVNGVLDWWRMTGIALSFVMLLVGAMPNSNVQDLAALVFFPLVGGAWVWFVWRASEKAFVWPMNNIHPNKQRSYCGAGLSARNMNAV